MARYFATVRRAMCTPCSCRRETISVSESAFDSSETI
jgi:hypothetical protein